jgi:hypothetical protein
MGSPRDSRAFTIWVPSKRRPMDQRLGRRPSGRSAPSRQDPATAPIAQSMPGGRGSRRPGTRRLGATGARASQRAYGGPRVALLCLRSYHGRPRAWRMSQRKVSDRRSGDGGLESGGSAGARPNGAADGPRGPVRPCRAEGRSLVDACLAQDIPAAIPAAHAELDPAPDGGLAIAGGERFEQRDGHRV